MMKETGILFSAPMVRAILAGRKTQTRRIVKPQPGGMDGDWQWRRGGFSPLTKEQACAYGPYQKDDRLWVRETWRAVERESDMVDGILYAADDAFIPIENTFHASEQWVGAYDNGRHGERWRPSIFMPRWASRITLEVTSVRVERVHDISEADAQAEGIDTSVVDPSPRGTRVNAKQYVHARDVFADLWREINGSASWDANPWVWAITFRVAEIRSEGVRKAG